MAQGTTAEMIGALEAAAERAKHAGVFATVSVDGPALIAHAKDTPSPVLYRIDGTEKGLFVSWNSEDRYLSQSIEADLMWTGDDLADLIDEELVDLGWNRGKLGTLAHHRDEQMFFTFKQPIPIEASSVSASDGEDLARCLLAYEIAFRELGDMSEDEDD